jgi:hypothetical protein
MISFITFIAGFCLGLIVYPIWVKDNPHENNSKPADPTDLQ